MELRCVRIDSGEIKKGQPAYKPGSVRHRGERRCVCHLSWPCRCRQALCSLPPGIGRAALDAPVYMTLQPIRRTVPPYSDGGGELLPRLFTLTERSAPGGSFLLRLLCRRRQLPVKKDGALCCPDFPLGGCKWRIAALPSTLRLRSCALAHSLAFGLGRLALHPFPSTSRSRYFNTAPRATDRPTVPGAKVSEGPTSARLH